MKLLKELKEMREERKAREVDDLKQEINEYNEAQSYFTNNDTKDEYKIYLRQKHVNWFCGVVRVEDGEGSPFVYTEIHCKCKIVDKPCDDYYNNCTKCIIAAKHIGLQVMPNTQD